MKYWVGIFLASFSLTTLAEPYLISGEFPPTMQVKSCEFKNSKGVLLQSHPVIVDDNGFSRCWMDIGKLKVGVTTSVVVRARNPSGLSTPVTVKVKPYNRSDGSKWFDFSQTAKPPYGNPLQMFTSQQ